MSNESITHNKQSRSKIKYQTCQIKSFVMQTKSGLILKQTSQHDTPCDRRRWAHRSPRPRRAARCSISTRSDGRSSFSPQIRCRWSTVSMTPQCRQRGCRSSWWFILYYHNETKTRPCYATHAERTSFILQYFCSKRCQKVTGQCIQSQRDTNNGHSDWRTRCGFWSIIVCKKQKHTGDSNQPWRDNGTTFESFVSLRNEKGSYATSRYAFNSFRIPVCDTEGRATQRQILAHNHSASPFVIQKPGLHNVKVYLTLIPYPRLWYRRPGYTTSKFTSQSFRIAVDTRPNREINQRHPKYQHSLLLFVRRKLSIIHSHKKVHRDLHWLQHNVPVHWFHHISEIPCKRKTNFTLQVKKGVVEHPKEKIKIEDGHLSILWGGSTYFCECIWPENKIVTNCVTWF